MLTMQSYWNHILGEIVIILENSLAVFYEVKHTLPYNEQFHS